MEVSSALVALALVLVAGDVEGHILEKVGVIDPSTPLTSSSVPDAVASSRPSVGHRKKRERDIDRLDYSGEWIQPQNDVKPRDSGASTSFPMISPHTKSPVTSASSSDVAIDASTSTSTRTVAVDADNIPTSKKRVAREADITSASSKMVVMDADAVSAFPDMVAKDAVSTDNCSSAILGLRSDLGLLLGSGVNASGQEALAAGRSLITSLRQLEAKVDSHAGESRDKLDRVESRLTSVSRLVTYLGSATLSSSTTCAGQVTALTSLVSNAMHEVKQHLSAVREAILSSTLSLQRSVSQVQDVVDNQTQTLQSSTETVQSTLQSTASDIQTALEEHVSSEVGKLRDELREMKRGTAEEIQELRRHLDDKMSKILSALTKPDASIKVNEETSMKVNEINVSESDARLRMAEELLNASLTSFKAFAEKTDQASGDFDKRLDEMNKRIETARVEMVEKIDKSTTATIWRLTSIESLLNSSTPTSRHDVDGVSQEMTSRLSKLTSTVEELRESINTSVRCRTDPSIHRLNPTEGLMNCSIAPLYEESIKTRQEMEKLNSRINALNGRVEQLAADTDENNKACMAKMSAHQESMNNLLNHTVPFLSNPAAESTGGEQELNSTLVSMETRLVSLSTRVEEKLEKLTSETISRLQPLQDISTTSMNHSNGFAAELMKRLAEINQRLQLLGADVENVTVDICRQQENNATTTPVHALSKEDVLKPLQGLLREQAAASRLGLGDVNSTLQELLRRVEGLAGNVQVLLAVNTSSLHSLTSRLVSAVDASQAEVAGNVRGLLQKADSAFASLQILHRNLATLTSNQTGRVLQAVTAMGREILRLLPWSSGPWVRLVGPSKSRGRLEVRHEGRWGTVCDDRFDDVSAAVVCRQLGLPDLQARAVAADKYGRGVDPIWLDDVTCPPRAATLTQCSHSGWGVHNCHHSEDVGVECG